MSRQDLVALDREVSNSTFAEEFKKAYPGRFFEMFIAEQQMVAAAVGFGRPGQEGLRFDVRGLLHAGVRPDPHGGCFQRYHSSGRLACGVSIGQDGPSQMGLEDLAMMRSVYGSTVLYPCDANQTAALVNAMVDLKGISYLRTTREKTAMIYPPGGVPGGRQQARQALRQRPSRDDRRGHHRA